MHINDDISKIEEIICVCYVFFSTKPNKNKIRRIKVELFAIKRRYPA